MAGVIVDVTGRVARLFQDDPGAFVAARNALARDLARAGQRDLSARVRALARPSTSAWLVNQLWWHERAEYDALLAAGAAARDAQQARLTGQGADLTRALAERDAIIARLVAQGERLAAAGGVRLSTDLRGRVWRTLEALALRAGDTTLTHGQLSADVALPGLQALAGLVLRERDTPAPRAVLALVQEPDGRRVAREEVEALSRDLAAVTEQRAHADTTLLDARDAADEADGALSAACQQVEAAQRALDVARDRLDQARALQAAAAARADATTAAVAEAEAHVIDLRARESEMTTRLDALTARRPRGRPR